MVMMSAERWRQKRTLTSEITAAQTELKIQFRNNVCDVSRTLRHSKMTVTRNWLTSDVKDDRKQPNWASFVTKSSSSNDMVAGWFILEES